MNDTNGIFILYVVYGWQEWTWEGNTSDDSPGQRRGHTMSLFYDTIIVFGGRSDDRCIEHAPKTYEIEEKEGRLNFITYDNASGNYSCFERSISKRKEIKGSIMMRRLSC